VLVVRQGDVLYASSAVCTHKKCVLKAHPQEIYCACHGSKYSLQGAPTKGPAKQPLFRYGISAGADGRITVDLSKHFEPNQWKDPASFVQLAPTAES
jgi:cytochrome b6-f complex iron-sulfur subunit